MSNHPFAEARRRPMSNAKAPPSRCPAAKAAVFAAAPIGPHRRAMAQFPGGRGFLGALAQGPDKCYAATTYDAPEVSIRSTRSC